MTTTSTTPDAARDAGQKIMLTGKSCDSSGMKEKRDCTVRAFANATGCSYEMSHAAFKAAGRKNRRGVKLKDVAQKVARTLGVSIKLECRSGTVGKFIKNHTKGRFIIRVSGHAFAVCDGEIFDTFKQSMGRRIKSAWIVDEEVSL